MAWAHIQLYAYLQRLWINPKSSCQVASQLYAVRAGFTCPFYKSAMIRSADQRSKMLNKQNSALALVDTLLGVNIEVRSSYIKFSGKKFQHFRRTEVRRIDAEAKGSLLHLYPAEHSVPTKISCADGALPGVAP